MLDPELWEVYIAEMLLLKRRNAHNGHTKCLLKWQLEGHPLPSLNSAEQEAWKR